MRAQHCPRVLRHAVCIAALLAPANLVAAPGKGSEIIVTGQVLSPQEAEERARTFVASMGMVSTVKPAARWQDRICPRVFGLGDPKVATRVETRIRAVASEAGARLAKSNCERNFVVVFTPDAAGLARALNAKDPRLMAETAPAARARLSDRTGAIRWWYRSEVRNADGQPLVTASLPWLAIESADGGSANGNLGGDSGGGYGTSYRASLVSTNAKRAISGVTVLVDVSLAEGKDLMAVTDYAALVGLAEIRFAGEPPPDSILSLFDSAKSVQSLTPQDRALLKSLYSLPLDRHGRYHRGWLVKDVSKSLTAGE